MNWQESDFNNLVSPWKEKLGAIFARVTQTKQVLSPIYYAPGTYDFKSNPEYANPDSCFLAWTFKDIPQLFVLEIFPDKISWFFQDQNKMIESEGTELPEEIFKYFDLYKGTE